MGGWQAIWTVAKSLRPWWWLAAIVAAAAPIPIGWLADMICLAWFKRRANRLPGPKRRNAVDGSDPSTAVKLGRRLVGRGPK